LSDPGKQQSDTHSRPENLFDVKPPSEFQQLDHHSKFCK